MEKSNYLDFLSHAEDIRQQLPKESQSAQALLALENLLLDELGIPKTETGRTLTIPETVFFIPALSEEVVMPTPKETREEADDSDVPEEAGEEASAAEPIIPEASAVPEEIPENETKKLESELVYDKYHLAVLSLQSGNTTEIDLFVAPLNQLEKSKTTVPVLVHVFSRGNYLTASSFDTLDAKNMLTISINGVDLLVRGSTDEQGRFASAVVTTGRTAQLGDKMSIVSKESHTDACTGIGHLHFTENGRSFRIFPLSRENEFICMTSDSEFTDYYVCAKSYGQPKIKIMGANQFPIELLTGWTGNTFEATLL